MAELIKWDLAKVGVDVKVRSVTRTFLTEQLRNHTEDYDRIFNGVASAGNLDPDGFMRPILSCDTQNEITQIYQNWCNTEILIRWWIVHCRLIIYMSVLKATKNGIERMLNELPNVPIANVQRLLVRKWHRKRHRKRSPFGSINFSTLYFMKTKQKK